MRRLGGRSRIGRAALAATAAVGFALAGAGIATAEVDTADTRLLAEPAIGGGHLAFIYAGDLWVAGADGSAPRRLTSHIGDESAPCISPDGSTIAFTASYDGNTDVYTIPASGGTPTRLTWHPGPDFARCFTPDGSAVLLASQREVFTNRYAQFFTVPVSGGMPEKLPIPNGHRAAFSPDGERIAYTPIPPRYQQWKNYRGGTTSRIWIYDRSDHDVEEVPRPEGGCNDDFPMWIGEAVYFLSDRDGEFNLYRYVPGTEEVERLTDHDDFPILSASAGSDRIVYEQGGRLFTFDPEAGESAPLTVGVAADLVETRPRYVDGARWIRGSGLSPTGKRAVFEFRGEILTVPAEKGDPRNLTETTGAHERSPSWSPDGASIAYFSDASGEYQLVVAPQDGKGARKTYTLDGAGFYDWLVWSPDSKKIAYLDNAQTLAWIDLESGESTHVGSNEIYTPLRSTRCAWSPDSKWLAYTLTAATNIQTLWLHSIDEGSSHQITEGLAEVAEPAFDPGGKYLYFLGSTNAGPVKQWFDLSSQDMQATSSVYMAVLDDDTPSPLLKESDEEEVEEEEDKSDEKEDEGEDSAEDEDEEGESDDEKADEAEEPITIDLEGLADRILALPIPSGFLGELSTGTDGQIYYIRREGGSPGQSGMEDGTPKLQRFDLEEREQETMAEGVAGYEVSADRKKILYRADETWGIADAGKFSVGDGKLDVAAIEVRIDPRAEWEQIFHEAWRINRDYFYATNYHGVDWPAMREKYAGFLPHLATRDDLNRVIRWMLSELAVGHSYLGGGDERYEPESVPGGLLGADYEVADGRYRFRKVYSGQNWNPELRAPLTAPGVDVEAGEYLLAVDGEDLRPPTNLYRLFENTSGKIVELKVGPHADGTDARTVEVVPIGDESALRNRDWVEGNLRKVHEATDGRVAYVYVPNTSTAGHEYFKRYFFPQADRPAIIVDERFNGGGSVADYFIELLSRPVSAHWATRHGKPFRTPVATIPGPKVMIIDETAGSGGDLLPWMFRKFELGPLVGKRTWGGLVGILGFPTLMDGGFVTAPDLAIFTEDGWVVENQGVPPDIEVEQWPAAVIAGHDPQLEKAIEVALELLEAKAPEPVEPPPFPVRNR